MGSFPLVPFCNRIRDGRASFEGREIQFPPNHPAQNSPHPLHGIGWQQAWDVDDTRDDEVGLSLRVPATAAWPWAFSSTQRYRVSPRELQVEITVRNEDDGPMPAGIG